MLQTTLKQETLLTLEEVCEILKVGQSTFRRWISEGKVKGIKVGRQWRFSSKILADILENGIDIEDSKAQSNDDMN